MEHHTLTLESSKEYESGYPKVTQVVTRCRSKLCLGGLEVMIEVNRRYTLNNGSTRWISALEYATIPYADLEKLREMISPEAIADMQTREAAYRGFALPE